MILDPRLGQRVTVDAPHVPEWHGREGTIVHLLPSTALEVRLDRSGDERPVVVVLGRAEVI